MEHYTEFLPISRADMEARGWDHGSRNPGCGAPTGVPDRLMPDE